MREFKLSLLKCHMRFSYLGDRRVTETSAASSDLVRSVVEALNDRGLTLVFSGSVVLLLLLVALSLDL